MGSSESQSSKARDRKDGQGGCLAGCAQGICNRARKAGCELRDGDPGGRLCATASSLCGEDVFYREAFHDCHEGSACHDKLFKQAREQASLKMRKGAVVAKYFQYKIGHSMPSTASTSSRASGLNFGQAEIDPGPLMDIVAETECISEHWLGTTIPQWRGSTIPDASTGASWMPGLGSGLKVRCGPDYVRNRRKTPAVNSMYEAISCDALKADSKIEDFVGRLVRRLPKSPSCIAESESGGGSPLQWTPECPLPRLLFVNLMLPYHTVWNPLKEAGPGCSFLVCFHIKPETIRASQSKTPPPHVRLFREFCDGPAGVPGGPVDAPERCLNARRHPAIKKQDRDTGLLKLMANCENPGDIEVPENLKSTFQKYNGQPCLITKSGYTIKDPRCEWMEIGIDVRKFSFLARTMLGSFRHLLPKTIIHYAMTIQAVEDEDMPENLIGDIYLHNINMVDDPIKLNN
uniref:Protein ENHANCED DISEASE RESISTANCE 2 C-terminal domain-containing protein n=1 Tax=Noctiluca scintillans TaxID=2966 RepID=A0A7S1AA93_NOCSC|mmetsp:Transcript_37670/g.100223  ORF Transcript_37670/g.100223 Transcript_37670/m.100223 type:complete len:461 (+) Transcript_37670:61-1443(+)|eukprot:CAMPEP_0194491200 /NCGR_PEP_ID=MMETSP0253-20130528/10160_1 /TAXON_ID=2966 /ORGANISM="Noctiluca scintillans" /LENGTH=460 /DNA_ID=CAMNT_0039331909 /DNA_START=55 /DNA_END=1437 /DNA_ORIENTATION=-